MRGSAAGVVAAAAGKRCRARKLAVDAVAYDETGRSVPVTTPDARSAAAPAPVSAPGGAAKAEVDGSAGGCSSFATPNLPPPSLLPTLLLLFVLPSLGFALPRGVDLPSDDLPAPRGVFDFGLSVAAGVGSERAAADGLSDGPRGEFGRAALLLLLRGDSGGGCCSTAGMASFLSPPPSGFAVGLEARGDFPLSPLLLLLGLPLGEAGFLALEGFMVGTDGLRSINWHRSQFLVAVSSFQPWPPGSGKSLRKRKNTE